MLSDVATEDLALLQEALRAGRLEAPVTELGLDRVCGRSLSRHAAALSAFDARSLPLLLDALLAERRSRPPTPELVWTGPEGRAGIARRTEVVFRELLDSARREVWMAGYSIDHGGTLFAPLHAAMKSHGVRARFLLHPEYERGERRMPTLQAGADLILNRFLERNWPFGAPLPEVWYDPRPLQPKTYASMHIKAVIVDDLRVLIGSANFTDRGQTRNYEAGAHLEDPEFARRLVRQLRSLIDDGLVVRHGAGA